MQSFIVTIELEYNRLKYIQYSLFWKLYSSTKKNIEVKKCTSYNVFFKCESVLKKSLFSNEISLFPSDCNNTKLFFFTNRSINSIKLMIHTS